MMGRPYGSGTGGLMSCAEIGRKLGIPERTVRWIIQRALVKIALSFPDPRSIEFRPALQAGSLECNRDWITRWR